MCVCVWNSSRRKKRGAFIFSSATVFPAMFKLIYNSNNDQKVPQSHDHNNGPRIPHEPYEPPFVVTTFGIVFITSHNIHTKYTRIGTYQYNILYISYIGIVTERWSGRVLASAISIR